MSIPTNRSTIREQVADAYHRGWIHGCWTGGIAATATLAVVGFFFGIY